MVISSSKYDVKTVSRSMFEVRMTVIVRYFQKEDAGSYKCIAKNSLGEVESNIRLYGKLIHHVFFFNYLHGTYHGGTVEVKQIPRDKSVITRTVLVLFCCCL